MRFSPVLLRSFSPLRPAAARILCALLPALFSPALSAQTTEPLSELSETTAALVRPRLSETRVQELLKEAQERTGADDDVRQKQITFYKQALEQVRQTDQWTSRTAEADAARLQAPALAGRLKEELAANVPDLQPQAPEAATLPQLEQLLSSSQQELADAQKLASDLSTELKRRADRRVEIPQLLSAARQRLQELKVEEASGPLPEEPAELTSARLLLVQARSQALERELEAHEKELQSYEARGELLTLRQDDASRRVARLEKLVKAWQSIVNERRRGEAEQAALEARQKQRAAGDAHPVVRRLTEENAALAEQRTGSRGLSARMEKVSHDLQVTQADLERLREQARGLRSKVDAVGLSDAIGILLRKQREETETLLKRIRATGNRKPVVSETHLRLLEMEDELASLRDPEKLVLSTVAEIEASSPTAGLDRQQLQSAVREIYQTRRDYLQTLIKDSNSYFGSLVELDTLEKQLREEARLHANYIDERILWMPSAGLLTVGNRTRLAESARWVFAPDNWAEVRRTLERDVRAHPWGYSTAALVPLMLLVTRRRLRRALEENCTRAGRSGSLSFYPAVRAGVATLQLAVGLPFVVWFAGWRLAEAEGGTDFTRAVAEGITASAAALLVLEIVRAAASRQGLAADCFHWAPGALRILRRNVIWLGVIVLPLRVLVEPAQWHGTEVRDETLARLLFLAGMIPCVLFAHRVLHPSRGVLPGTIARDRDGWLFRLRYLCYAAGLAIPILFGLAAVIGYHYTALHLGARLLTTLWLCLGLIALNALLVHWLVVSRRRLALQEARRRWQAEKENEEGGEMPAPPEEPVLDVSTASAQANRFLRSFMAFAFLLGLWLVWVDVLPALGILNNYELWSRQVSATEVVTAADGSRTLQVVEKVAPVTLADAFFAALLVLMTAVAARNLPGILEIAVLQRLKLDHGAKYAFSTVARYIIILAGTITALRSIGVGWNNVQWMAAAITVGLGFGLQEIFANFVSGLILLFERPIRAGDVVMVNGILGKVGRIQIRATTIVDMDHKELIIPNKEFITGQVINYTLSDTVIRLTVTVCVAHGSDYDLARDILLRLAAEHPIILDDPAPIAALAEFKEGTAEFLLFVHLPDLNNFLAVRHDLIAGIEREFTQAGIRIPLPQRDLHVRGIEDALPATLQRAGGGHGPREKATVG